MFLSQQLYYLLSWKNKECFGKPVKFRKFSFFFQIWFSFSTIGGESGGNWIKFELLFIVTTGKTCEKTKSKFKKTAKENFRNLSGFPKHFLFFS